MTATTTYTDDVDNRLSAGRRLAILVMCVLASTVVNASLLVASTILPQMKGALAATEDEIAWAMTFNILATAVATPMTGWLDARFGRRAVMVWSTLGFSIATALCGLATSLETLVIWRILQGAFGAPLVPLGQTILIDSFPRHQHGLVMSAYGMAGVIGPVCGPTLGGLLAEDYGWSWAFFMFVPAGLAAAVGLRAALVPDRGVERKGLDWFGFITLSVAIAAVQLVLSRGQRLDWFESTEIIIETVVAVLAFYLFVAHTMTAKKPYLSPRLFADRSLLLGLVLVGIYGMLNFTPMVLLPPLLQQHAGYPDSLIGQIIGARGIGALIGFLTAMLTTRLDPRAVMIFGFGLQIVSGLWLMSIDLNVSMTTLAINSMIQGAAVGIIWVPLTVVTFQTLDKKLLAEGTAVFHLVRNVCSSFFISICVAEIVRATGANYSRMTEIISPYNRVLVEPWSVGGWSLDSAEGLARIAKEIGRQAAMIGYVNAFLLYTLMSVIAVPLILAFARSRRR